MNNYIEITNLEQIIEKAKKKIDPNQYILNFILQSQFTISILKNETFLHEASLAQDFQNPNRPEHLYINHGEYIKENGISHLISTLKEKENSNRALISLINQDNIIDSGDKPIPSFMSIQANIENHKDLYTTIHFRALEVSKFLKINLEEIRLIINEIYKEFIDLENVYLTIFAFRAYIKDSINPLIRPKLELLSESRLLKILEKKAKTKLIPLLEEKKSVDSTVVDDESFKNILRILNDVESNIDIPEHLKSKHTKGIVSSISEISDKIKDLRAKDSHNADIDSLYSAYKSKIEKLINEISTID